MTYDELKQELESLKKELYDNEMKYTLNTPKDKDRLYLEYQEKRNSIKKRIAKVLNEIARIQLDEEKGTKTK